MKTLASALVLTMALSSTALAQGRQRGRDNAPKVGQAAPDFKAKRIGKSDYVELSKAVRKAKKPVVLIFGSIT